MNEWIRRDLWRRLADFKWRHWFAEAVLYRRLAWQLRQMRKDRGWSVREVARRAHLGWSTVARYETGLGPMKIETLLRLAAVFDVGLLIWFTSWSEFVEDLLDKEPSAPRSFEQESA